MNRSRTRTHRFLTAAACGLTASLILGTSASAAIFESDFENPPYTLSDLNGQDGWLGDAMWDVSNTNAIDGQSLQNGASTTDGRVSHTFTGQSGTFYAGFDLKVENNDVGLDPNFYWLAVSDDDDDNNSLGMVWSGPTPNFATRGRQGSSNTGGTIASYTSGETYRFVLQFSKTNPLGNYNTVALYQDPTGSDINALTPVSTVTEDIGLTSLDTFWLRQGGDVTADVLTLDNLVITTDFGAAVPEPASLALMGLGALCLMPRRRR